MKSKIIDKNKDIVFDFYKTLKNASKTLRIFYRAEDNKLYIMYVIKDFNDPDEDSVYETKRNILHKYPNSEIDLRVIPRFNRPLNTIIPEGFKRLYV